MTTHPPQKASDFEAIYWPDASCGVASSQGDCHQPGVVLGYDVFSPEIGIWFCALHWPEFEDMITMVEDKRPLVLFFQAVADIAAMKIVEDIFHNQEASNFAAEENDDAESDYHAREVERLEDALEETDYSYIGINNIIYLYRGDGVIADLDTDDYSWKRTDEGIDPLAKAEAIIDAINEAIVEDRRQMEGGPDA